MKKVELKEGAPVFLIGKGSIIIAMLIVSAVCFILGYFVGQRTVEVKHQGQLIQEPDRNSTLPAKPPDSQMSSMPPVVQPTENPGSGDKNASRETKDPAVHKTEPAPVQNQSPQLAQAKPGKESKPGQKQQTLQETAITPEAKEIKKAAEDTKSIKTIKYTVQVGAFNSPREADTLKARLVKKGHKAYIVKQEQKQHKGHIKVYKVRVGEFSARKDAEVLAVRIKSSEGLPAFVATR
jgi:cell division septation protein DedD